METNNDKNLYLFDFDGTLTKKDTLFDFLQFSFPKKYNSIFLQFIPLFLLAKFKLLDPGKAKEKFISSFLKGKTKLEIESMATTYFQSRKDILFRKRGLKYIKNLAQVPDKYIVTASPDLWVAPFAKYLGAKLISTQAEFENDVFTGRFKSKNCNNQEKVERIKKEIDITRFTEIYAFGDTKGDQCMLKLSTKPHFRYFE